MFPLREDTASQEVMLGPFLDTDGVPVTGLTIANTDIRLQKHGASTFANKNSGGASHVEDGYYLATFDATDSDTAGPMRAQIIVTGALPVREDFIVMTQGNFDASVLGSAASGVNVVSMDSNVIGSGQLASGAITSAKIATDAINANAFAQTAADKAWSTGVRGLTNATIIWEDLVANYASESGTLGQRLSRIPNIAPGANGGLPTVDASNRIAGIQGTVNTLDTLAGFIDTEVAAILTIAQKLDTALELDGAVYRFTVNALENAPAGGGGGTADWTAGEREQIRHRLGIDGTAAAPSATPSVAPSASTVAATVRTELSLELARLDAAISTRATPAQVNSEVTDVISADTHTLPAQGAPPASPSLEVAILYLYKFLRNKQERTNTELRVYDDAGTSVDHKAALADDGGVFSKGEIVTGP